MTDKTDEFVTDATPVQDGKRGFHFARRGSAVDEDAIASGTISGYEDDRMRARTLLTAEEEKRLMRRIDWRLMVPAPLSHP